MTIVKEYHKARKEYRTAKLEMKLKEADLILNTDFKAEGCTNQKMKDAFILKTLECDLKPLLIKEMKYKQMKDLFNYELAEMNIEGDLYITCGRPKS